jgi:DnaJ-class molecular chaperone
MSDIDFEILGISRDSDEKEIKRKYKEISLFIHPDKQNNNPISENLFKIVSRSYQNILNRQDKICDCTASKRYNDLLSKHNGLLEEYRKLRDQYNELLSKHNELLEKYGKLNDIYSEIVTAANNYMDKRKRFNPSSNDDRYSDNDDRDNDDRDNDDRDNDDRDNDDRDTDYHYINDQMIYNYSIL